jgi:D-alanine-D-alanine ligase
VEVTCGILGQLEKRGEITLETPCALPPILIRPKHSRSFFDYNSKYLQGEAEELCPAPLPAETIKNIQHMTMAAHRSLGLQNYSRADFILQPDGKVALLEINTLPGMTGTSLVPQEAAAIGLSFPDLLERLLELGLATRRK